VRFVREEEAESLEGGSVRGLGRGGCAEGYDYSVGTSCPVVDAPGPRRWRRGVRGCTEVGSRGGSELDHPGARRRDQEPGLLEVLIRLIG
jgi:hypothetical protein